MKLEVQKTGLYTTIQDGGRKGFMDIGIPHAGPMDKGAARRANWLVGNPLDHPVLELTLLGPTLLCLAPGSIAITGADLSAKIDDQHLPMNQTHLVQSGEVISFGKAENGCRAYLSIAGEWKVSRWLKSMSASTTEIHRFTPESMLAKKQILETQIDNPVASFREIAWREENSNLLRVVKGPEFDLFDRKKVDQFLGMKHRVSNHANRMGYRLENDIALEYDKTMISSGVLPGAVQITRSGSPILLMADAQTSGGYPRLFFVIHADLDRAGQLKPGDEITFELIDYQEADEANRAYASWEQLLFK